MYDNVEMLLGVCNILNYYLKTIFLESDATMEKFESG